MEQGMHVEIHTRKERGSTVPVTQRSSIDATCSTSAIDAQSVNESIRNGHSAHTLSILAPQVRKSSELLIRALDMAGCLAVLFSAMPVMVVVALLVKISSEGRVLYKQKRVGKSGKIFTLYKFRTMINNAEEHTGPVWAAQEDSRVTPIGRVLRKTRLDELPQLFNVLGGDMSLVGPRPERPYFVERHKALQGIRLSIRPGVTGLAQIRKFYNLKPEHKIKYDYLYIQKRSLFLNLYILVKTIPVILAGNGW